MSNLDPAINNGEPLEIKIDDPVILQLLEEVEKQKALATKPDALLCFKTYLKYRMNGDDIEVYGMTLSNKPFEHADKFDRWFEFKTYHPTNSVQKVFQGIMEVDDQKFDRVGVKIEGDFPVQIKSSKPLPTKTDKKKYQQQIDLIISEIRSKPFQFLSGRHIDDNTKEVFFLITKHNFEYETPEKVHFTMNSSELK